VKRSHPFTAGVIEALAWSRTVVRREKHGKAACAKITQQIISILEAQVPAMSVKLRDLGVKWKSTENEVRARLSELRRLGMVGELWQGGQVWHLTDLGEHELAEITPQLYDDELACFSK
jgi:hypothetical protein